MGRIFSLLLLPLLVLAAPPKAWGGEQANPGRTSRRALNRAFRGRILEVKDHRVTIMYDFEDPLQIRDFEEARPPRLLDATRNDARIEGGRLILDGSTSIRHRMEGAGRISAHLGVRAAQQRNIGAVFTEPVLSDFYVVYNLFDFRFNMNGNMYIGACGLREDEGAEDAASGLVNFRDIFGRDIRRKAAIGRDLDVEIAKEGWTEYFRVDDVKGKGSSKGKTKEMKSFQFGLFVHGSRASFDDLTLTVDVGEEFLSLNNLCLEIAPSPLAGVAGVPAGVQRMVDGFLVDRAEGNGLVAVLAQGDVPSPVRETVAGVLADTRDAELIPYLTESLASADVVARRLAIRVVTAILGKDFGYEPEGTEAQRAMAIRAIVESITPPGK